MHRYEKYFKMLKFGMPLPAVQHSMTRDGLDATVMEGNHNLPAQSPKQSKGNQGGGGSGVPLKQDPTYTKYFKMLKLGLPMGAVKNAMERDGLDPKIMDGDHNAPISMSNDDGHSNVDAAKRREKDTHRRTRLHWDTLGHEEVNSNSVWAMVEEDEELCQLEIDEAEFTTLFQTEIKARQGGSGGGIMCGGSGPGGGGRGGNVVQVIDPKRANNGGIILARLRMSYDDMAKAVERMDETAMTANQAKGIIEYMPTLQERKSLRDYMKAASKNKDESAVAKSFERLCECEKFMVAMMTVRQSKRKIRALLFKLQFRGCIHDLAHDVFSIEKACDELSNSVRLRKIFGIVLNIGNRLNTAGPGQKRKAGAFTIKSLLKLNQAKAFDNKTTFLHYVVLVVQRNSEALLDFKDDLPTVSKAGKIYWDQCVSELEEVETQLENVRKLALHEAKTNKIVYSLPNKSKQTEVDNDSDDLSVESMSLEDEVALLRSTKIGMFALSAIRKVSQLRERVDTAKVKFSSLLEYFGESGDSKLQPHALFEIITTFCRNFDVAREDVEKMEKTKKRVEKKEKQDENRAIHRSDSGAKNEKLKSIRETPVKKNPPRPKASSLQPNMGNVLADLKRATSAKFSSLNVNAGSVLSSGQGSGPPKVTPRNPDDEISPTVSDEKSETSSHDPAHAPTPHHRRIQPTASSPSNNAMSEVRAKEAETRARAQAEADEAARIAMEAEEKRLADESAAAEEEAARIAMQEKRLAQEAADAEAARIATKHQQRAEEDVAAAEAARKALEQNHHAEETVAAPRSYEAEVEGPTGRSATNEKKNSPKSNQAMTRRELMAARRERARNRHSLTTSTPPKPAPTPPPPTVTRSPAKSPQARSPQARSPQHVATSPAPSKEEEPKQEAAAAAVHKPTPSANASARASARDRYARHKKMLQHR
ncbi:hypothetical protein ACHAXR_007441, partial [Thalassiosira sp. AJA248-18]